MGNLEQEKEKNTKLTTQLTELKSIKTNQDKLSVEFEKIQIENQQLKNQVDQLTKTLSEKQIDTMIELEVDKELRQEIIFESNPVKLCVDDAKENVPCTEGDKLYISSKQRDMMEQDPYFKQFFSEKYSTNISHKEFLDNLRIYLNSDVYALCQSKSLGVNTLKQSVAEVSKQFDDFFADLGVSKDKAFVNRNGDTIGEAASTILQNLAHADLMDNQVLVMFWCQALKDHMPFAQCIDQFTQFVAVKLNHAEYLHEILFEQLLQNADNSSTQTFLNENKIKLKVKILDLDQFLLGVAKDLKKLTPPGGKLRKVEDNVIIVKEDPDPYIMQQIDKFLNLLDLDAIEIVQRGVYKYAIGAIEATGFASVELNYILTHCKTSLCVRNGQGITGRFIQILVDFENGIPIIDFSEYRLDQSLPDYILAARQNHFEIIKPGVRLLCLKGHEEKVAPYLKTYYGITE